MASMNRNKLRDKRGENTHLAKIKSAEKNLFCLRYCEPTRAGRFSNIEDILLRPCTCNTLEKSS